VQAAILFAKAIGDRDRLLLDVVATSSTEAWYAGANVLLEAKAPGFAAHLLEHLRLRLLIFVSEDGTVGGGSGSSSLAIADGADVEFDPSGYPPRAEYQLESFPGRGAVVLSTGPRTMYYRRAVGYNVRTSRGSSSRGGPTQDDRMAYLTALQDNPIGKPSRTKFVESCRLIASSPSVDQLS
jgi:hypothetical protein